MQTPEEYIGSLEHLQSPLTEMHMHLLRLSVPYLTQGRYWDCLHTILALQDLNDFIQGESTYPEGMLYGVLPEELVKVVNVLVPAIICHDIGWSFLSEEQKNQWDRIEYRKEHMDLGAKKTPELLAQISYPREYWDDITYIVANHDNKDFGTPGSDRNQIIFKAIDALWILRKPSFWKDYWFKGFVDQTAQNTRMSPDEYLHLKREKYSGKQVPRFARDRVEMELQDIQHAISFFRQSHLHLETPDDFTQIPIRYEHAVRNFNAKALAVLTQTH